MRPRSSRRVSHSTFDTLIWSSPLGLDAAGMVVRAESLSRVEAPELALRAVCKVSGEAFGQGEKVLEWSCWRFVAGSLTYGFPFLHLTRVVV